MGILASTVDSLMGGAPETPCSPDHPGAMALVGAGLGLLSDTSVQPDMPLSAFGTPKELNDCLRNLNALYLPGACNLGEDIINDVTVGEMIGHLDLAQVEAALDRVIAFERHQVDQAMHAGLEDLKNNIT